MGIVLMKGTTLPYVPRIQFPGLAGEEEARACRRPGSADTPAGLGPRSEGGP